MEKNQFFERYSAIFEKNELSQYATTATMEKMYAMVENMLRVNAVTNLTAITDWEGIIVKHLADSCTVLPHLPEGATVLDVGCGGGFPSLPMAIARPDLRVTGLDSTGKKVAYVNESAALLGLENLTAICGRAEELGRGELRESFSAVTARAVAALPVLAELCLPFVQVGGSFFAMKASTAEEELVGALGAYRVLGVPSEELKISSFSLLSEASSEVRVIIEATKTTPTPAAYPRAYAQIKKKAAGGK